MKMFVSTKRTALVQVAAWQVVGRVQPAASKPDRFESLVRTVERV